MLQRPTANYMNITKFEEQLRKESRKSINPIFQQIMLNNLNSFYSHKYQSIFLKSSGNFSTKGFGKNKIHKDNAGFFALSSVLVAVNSTPSTHRG
jgi:hypothetical protein